MTWNRVWTACLALALAPQMAQAADVWMRQERDGSGVEFVGSMYTSATYPDAATVPGGFPTEPKGCKVGDTTTACSLSNTTKTAGSTVGDDYYGWPFTNAVSGNDAYMVISNFWNNEWELSDTTLYPDKVVVDPFDRRSYGASHVQYNVPAGFSDAWPGGRPVWPYVTGNEVVKAATDSTAFSVEAYTGNSAGAGDRNVKTTITWIDERHFPASYPFIFKGCHQSKCTQSGGAPAQTSPSLPALSTSTLTGAPFPIQVGNLGTIQSDWEVDLGTTGTAGSTAIYDVAYDIWFEIPNRSFWQANPWDRTKTCDADPASCSTKYYAGMPESEKVVTQPWGTELMIWINAQGFTGWNGGDWRTGAITPAAPEGKGPWKTDVTIAGRSYDIWVGQGRDPKQSHPTPASGADTSDQWNAYWNIVSFVDRAGGQTGFHADTQKFVQYMLDNMQNACPVAYVDGEPQVNASGDGAPCVDKKWFLTEVGAGFEIWRDGTGLKTKSFSVKPTFGEAKVPDDVPGATSTTIPAGVNLMTDRWSDPDSSGKVKPIINWQKYIQVWVNNFCAGGRATYDIRTNDSFQSTDGVSVAKWCDGNYRWSSSGKTRSADCATGSSDPVAGSRRNLVNVNGTDNQWYGIMESGQRMWDLGMHGETEIHFYCNGTDDGSRTVTLFIDPSGRILNASGSGPIDGATVKLLKQAADGSFQLAVNPADPNAPGQVFQPRRNPDTSSGGGFYGWDVVPGVYKVTAEKPGCWVPGIPSQTVVESQVMNVVADPFYNVDLYLACPGPTAPPPGGDTPGLNVTLKTTSNWTSGGPSGKGGFCKTVQLTNTTSAAITGWQVTFPVENSALYTAWNANYSQPSNTQVRAKNQDNWVKTIQPGQTTDAGWLGFCSNRLP